MTRLEDDHPREAAPAHIPRGSHAAGDAPGDTPLPLLTHLSELRRRLLNVGFVFLVAFAGLYFFKEKLFALLADPLVPLLQQWGGQFIYTDVSEAFTTYLKMCFFGAAALSLPVLLLQVWLFIAPALHKRERTVAWWICLAAPVLLLTGALFAYFCIIPRAWEFFIMVGRATTTSAVPVQLHAKVSDYLGLIAQVLFAFGLSFQLPLVLVLMGHLGLVKAQTLRQGRKYALLGLMIVSALLTPPDVLSMLGMTLPLYGLYETAALVLSMMERRARPSKV